MTSREKYLDNWKSHPLANIAKLFLVATDAIPDKREAQKKLSRLYLTLSTHSGTVPDRYIEDTRDMYNGVQTMIRQR